MITICDYACNIYKHIQQLNCIELIIVLRQVSSFPTTFMARSLHTVVRKSKS